jgi:F0F1-type ATP synthase membrane subunit b/b'
VGKAEDIVEQRNREKKRLGEERDRQTEREIEKEGMPVF